MERAIRRRVERDGWISYRAFMEWALYHPEDGYYTRPGMMTGRRGDFSTSPDVAPAFGRRLAVQAAEIHSLLGGGSWRMVELGPGRGLLAGDLLEGLERHAPASLAALEEVVLVEISSSLREVQRRHLAAWSERVEVTWAAGLEGLPAVEGVVLANEFFDALPVHLVERRGGDVLEVGVALAAGGELRLEAGPRAEATVAAIAEDYALVPREGDRAEVCSALPGVLAELARILPRGGALVVDYGLPAAILGDRAHREGTAVGYFEHRVVTDLLARPGRQDLTAHVNWDHLEDTARAAGFTVVGRTWQDRFLMALGLLEDLAAPEGGDEDPAATAERLAARALILPGGGGKRFEVLGLARGLAGPWRGWSMG
ncbi:MAG: SAM-dependent methyltransferase [Acidobacteriota bacterium]|nr:SAM-dependent methyltransferase [Acidobacteriota bacterium]